MSQYYIRWIAYVMDISDPLLKSCFSLMFAAYSYFKVEVRGHLRMCKTLISVLCTYRIRALRVS